MRRLGGMAVSPTDAALVTAVTIAAQTVAITPGGIGTYEAAAHGGPRRPSAPTRAPRWPPRSPPTR